MYNAAAVMTIRKEKRMSILARWQKLALPNLGCVLLLFTQLAYADTLPTMPKILRDIAYGSDPAQRFDVYLPPNPQHAPIIFMVHGGAWKAGDKNGLGIINNKIAHWLPQGYIFVSTNYRLFPNAPPQEQVKDVAKALATAQQQAASWGGDPAQFILMGHSAGAHLITLLAVSPTLAQQNGVKPYLGTVSLDSAALNVEQLMQARQGRFFADVFGKDAQYWPSVSPYHQLKTAGKPLLMVCSIKRGFSCPPAKSFVEKAQGLGNNAALVEEDLSHADINQQLGLDNLYTKQVDSFMQGLRSNARKP